MKHSTKRLAAAAMGLVLAIGTMTGCGNSGGKGKLHRMEMRRCSPMTEWMFP